MPAVMAGSRRTAARVTPGAISLSSSSHFALKLYSNIMNPVALPPGRAKLSTKPEPTGSGTITNTIGTVRVACSIGPTPALPEATMTSDPSATNSAACLRVTEASPADQRASMRTLRPSVQPSCWNASRNAAWRARASGWSAGSGVSTPTRRIRSACCARTAERPRRRGAAEQRDEVAAPHSITSSARASSIGGTSRPSAFAVLRLITSSYLVGA